MIRHKNGQATAFQFSATLAWLGWSVAGPIVDRAFSSTRGLAHVHIITSGIRGLAHVDIGGGLSTPSTIGTLRDSGWPRDGGPLSGWVAFVFVGTRRVFGAGGWGT
jgi:hypothetical protein